MSVASFLGSFSFIKKTATMPREGREPRKEAYATRRRRFLTTAVRANALATTTAARLGPWVGSALAETAPQRALFPPAIAARTSAARSRADFRNMIIPRFERGPCGGGEAWSCGRPGWRLALENRARGRVCAFLVGMFATCVNHKPSPVSPQLVHRNDSFDGPGAYAYACFESPL